MGYTPASSLGCSRAARLPAMSSSIRTPLAGEADIAEKLVSVLQQHFSQPIRVARVRPLAGHLHSTYLIRLTNETHLLLKCSPCPTTPLLRREHVLLDTEARALSLLNRSALPCIPKLFYYDPMGQFLGPTSLVRCHIQGSTLADAEAQFTGQDRRALDRSLGILAKRIAQHTSDSFGSLGQVAGAAGKKSWREAFLVLFECLLRDSEDVFINLPYGEIRYHVGRLSPVLDEISRPRLVVVDFGQPSQVVVDPETRRLCGISGFGTAVWGDVYMARMFENPSTSMVDGFGSSFPRTHMGRTRQLLYVFPPLHIEGGDSNGAFISSGMHATARYIRLFYSTIGETETRLLRSMRGDSS
ncbi:hypothetical protein BJY04DRAFT_160599 [Aspergillus karnatakaensis]|uniref:phosphotransferase family protein n=1 Tax=Aspergillus karnatakaensis TaxID=1810916 RepID=UPI003CCD657B